MADKQYRIQNWSDYNKALINRANLTIWFSAEAIQSWHAQQKSGKAGRPRLYADAAILCALTIRSVFHLPLRGAQGFLKSLVHLLKEDIEVPDYTTLSRRQKSLHNVLPSHLHKGPIDLVIDSTGLKVYGEGEWKVKKHGPSKHRVWRKLHLAINPATHMIEASLMTTSSCTDGRSLAKLIDPIQGKINSIIGDGAYDAKHCYQTIHERGAKPIIPPRRNAVLQENNKKAWLDQRDTYVSAIKEVGMAEWKKAARYHRRSLVETGMYRFKTILGDKLKSRNARNQEVESALKCRILNKMASLGMPIVMSA